MSMPVATSAASRATFQRRAGSTRAVTAINTGIVPIGSMTTQRMTNCSIRL